MPTIEAQTTLPSVSVIIPVRNGEHFIGEAISSALSQGTMVREVIVVDDGSTDQTVARVQAIADQRVKLLFRQQGARGVSIVRNLGLAETSSDWVMFLDADDRLVPGSVAGLFAFEHAGSIAVYGDYERIDEGGQVIGHRSWLRRRSKPSGNILEALLGGNFIVNGGIMIVRRDAMLAIGGFDTRLRYAEDWVTWCRLAAEGNITYANGLHVLDYRVHTTSVMMSAPLMLDDCMPAVDAIFDDETIMRSVNANLLAELKHKAAAHMESYCVSQAIRSKRYGTALNGLAHTLVSDPKKFPHMALRAGAAFIGI